MLSRKLTQETEMSTGLDIAKKTLSNTVELYQREPILIVFVAVFLIFAVACTLNKAYRYKKANFSQIDRMTGKEFENYLVFLFRKLGYEVRHTGRFGDYGGDLVVKKDGVKTLVQAKRSKYPVRQKAVQEAVAAKGVYGCTKAMVVTNNLFTGHAQNLAKANGVELWGRERLAKSINQIRKWTT